MSIVDARTYQTTTGEDIRCGICDLKNVVDVEMSLHEHRNEIGNNHRQWFEKAGTIAELLDVAGKKPRRPRRQTQCTNILVESVEDYQI